MPGIASPPLPRSEGRCRAAFLDGGNTPQAPEGRKRRRTAFAFFLRACPMRSHPGPSTLRDRQMQICAKGSQTMRAFRGCARMRPTGASPARPRTHQARRGSAPPCAAVRAPFNARLEYSSTASKHQPKVGRFSAEHVGLVVLADCDSQSSRAHRAETRSMLRTATARIQHKRKRRPPYRDRRVVYYICAGAKIADLHGSGGRI